MEDESRIQVLYTKQCERFVKQVSDALWQFYEYRTFRNEVLPLIPTAYNAERKQYYASSLLEYLSRSKHERVALWLVDQDIYYGEHSYVFGYSARGFGAIVSTFRLKKDEQVLKEAMHEAGHVIGLRRHCANRCLMRSSTCVEEVEMKPYRLCDTCKEEVKSINIKS